MFAERRGRQRYRIEQDMSYRCLSGGQPTDEGVGRIVDISSAGVRFTTSHALRVGSVIEISMKWPALLDDRCLLKLEIFGLVVRSDAHEAAVRIAHYEFKTRSSNAFPGPPHTDTE